MDRKTGLITKSDRLYVDILEGDEASETIFSDYAGAGFAKAPRSMHVREAGDVALRADLDIDINPEFADSAFEFDAENYDRVGPSQPYPKRIEQLADGVFVLHGVSDPQHNAFAVEFKNYIVVIEAPETSEGGERLIEKAKELIPGKPIRYAAITHHHADHIGGLRSFIAEGASVITTPGNRKIIEALAKAPHDDRLGRNPRPLRLELIENGKRILTDGTRTLEFIDIGPHPHAREMVIAYMPEERLIFQGDVFIVPSNEAPVGPPVASFAAFAKAIDDLGLDVTRIAGAHGRTATMEEFRERMAVTEPAD